MQIRLLAGESINPDYILKLDEALRQYLPQRETPTVNINIVETLRARCPHCGKTSDVPVELVDEQRAKGEATARAAPVTPATVEPPSPPPVPPVQYRNDVPSAFHAQVVGKSQFVPPLKRFQRGIHDTRSAVSPMSGNGHDPSPRREYAPAGSARDELNPQRKDLT
jgi:hypothetical protein